MCKFNKGYEKKIVLWAQQTQIVCYERTSLRSTDGYTDHLPGQTLGYISLHPIYAYDSTHFASLNKCQVYLRLCKRRHLKHFEFHYTMTLAILF